MRFCISCWFSDSFFINSCRFSNSFFMNSWRCSNCFFIISSLLRGGNPPSAFPGKLSMPCPGNSSRDCLLSSSIFLWKFSDSFLNVSSKCLRKSSSSRCNSSSGLNSPRCSNCFRVKSWSFCIAFSFEMPPCADANVMHSSTCKGSVQYALHSSLDLHPPGPPFAFMESSIFCANSTSCSSF